MMGGIAHIEDLKIDQFISSLRNLRNYEISEKIDGSNIQFGLDEKGFYTAREGKGGERVYNVDMYDINFATTFQRSAHLALEQRASAMNLSVGDKLEAEVLFGKLPNAIPYSADKNQIIFLRVVEGNVNLDSLRQALEGDTVVVELPAPYTSDGKTIHVADEHHTWSFSQTPTTSGNKYLNDALKQELNTALDKLEEYLIQPSGIWEFSNAEVLSIPLNKRPEGVTTAQWKDLKVQVKQARANVQTEIYKDENGQRTGFKARIKDLLLNNMVRQTKSAFGPEIENGGWIEGVVFKNKETGEMFKVVDKDMFTSVKNFLWQVRSNLSDKPRNVDNIESFMGNVLHGLSCSLGHPDLGTYNAKRYLRKQGKTRSEILTNMSQGVEFDKVRNQWVQILDQQTHILTEELENYRKTVSEKEFITNFNGTLRKFKYDVEVNKRTLQTFSVMYKQLDGFSQGANNAKSTSDLIMLLSGRQLNTL